ncbi:WXG100 family type VII secretion target [Micromonospora sp. NPDC050397]|uniref:WXG100 family type VII secretion target n=1 Tax=Micromonospora sp. NPDC050397 TaxID=3364279 RepID=UPI00384ED1BA
MSDEYVQRYQHLSHEELYQAVQAGDAEQVEALASKWSALKTTIDGLGQSLRQDLDALARTWSSEAGEEFQRRLNLVISYSNSVAIGMGGVNEGLTLMAGPLRAAQKDAESPEETDDHDQALKGAAKGAIFGPAGIVVGGFLGHQQDKEEQERAHQRMVTIVAGLAAAYDLSAYDRLVTPPVADPDTPDTVNRTPPQTQSGPGATAPTRIPGSGPTSQTGNSRAEVPHTLVGGPGTGTPDGRAPTGRGTSTGSGNRDDDRADKGDGTALAGAGLLTGWTAGAGGMAGAAAGVGAPAAGGGTGLFAGQMSTPAGGVLGSGALSGSGSSAGSPAGRPGGGGAGAEARSASGAARAEGGSRQGAAGATERSAAGRSGSGGRGGVLGGSGHGQPDDDEGDERLTWLTEDDMVWRGDESGAPPVLGASDH